MAFWMALCATTARAALPGGSAEVQADRLTVDHQARSARFEGHVSAVYAALTLTCDTLEVAYAESGEIVSLKATGHVEVTRGETRATAGEARLDARQALLVLEQRPVLVQNKNRLSGKRITVALSTGRVEVVEARGAFVFREGVAP